MPCPPVSPRRPVAPRRRRDTRRWLLLLPLLCLVAVACQVNVVVDTKVEDDGSGTVTVGVGLDDKALTRVGNPDQAVRVDDLKAAGWTLAPVAKEADGFTWLRATKHFDNPEQLAGIMNELTGGKGAFRDFKLTKASGLGKTTWAYSGTVDLTKGLDTFSDPEVAAALNGDPFGGNVAAIEKEEGRSATQMVSIDVSVQLPNGQKQSWKPTFADPTATQINAESTRAQPLPVIGAEGTSALLFLVGGAVVVVVVVVLVALRSRFRGAR